MRVACLFSLLLASCQQPAAPRVWPGVPFTPPPHWRPLFSEMEQCSGRRGDYDRIRWFRSPDHSLGSTPGQEAVARWVRPHDIYLASRVVQIEAKTTIQHEMLHDLTQDATHGAVFDSCRVR